VLSLSLRVVAPSACNLQSKADPMGGKCKLNNLDREVSVDLQH